MVVNELCGRTLWWADSAVGPFGVVLVVELLECLVFVGGALVVLDRRGWISSGDFGGFLLIDLVGCYWLGRSFFAARCSLDFRRVAGFTFVLLFVFVRRCWVVMSPLSGEKGGSVPEMTLRTWMYGRCI